MWRPRNEVGMSRGSPLRRELRYLALPDTNGARDPSPTGSTRPSEANADVESSGFEFSLEPTGRDETKDEVESTLGWMKRLAVAQKLSDEFLEQLSWTHCVQFFTAPAFWGIGDDCEWCCPGELVRAYSLAAGNMRISSSPTVSGTILRSHLEELELLVRGTIIGMIGSRSSYGYGGYWEIYHWSHPTKYRPLFRFKTVTFGLWCPSMKAVQFGTTDLQRILIGALRGNHLGPDTDLPMGSTFGWHNETVQPFEGTTLYHPHHLLAPSPTALGSHSDCLPKDQQPIPLKWAVWRTDDDAQARDQAALKWRVIYWKEKARQELQQQNQEENSEPRSSQKPLVTEEEVNFRFLRDVAPIAQKDDIWKMCSELHEEDKAFQMINLDLRGRDRSFEESANAEMTDAQ